MYNTVLKVAGVAALGGLGLFAGYSYTQSRAPQETTETVATPVDGEAAAEASTADSLPTPEEIAAAQATSVEDVTADDVADLKDQAEAEALKALGEGGLLGDGEAPVVPDLNAQDDVGALTDDAVVADIIDSLEQAADAEIDAATDALASGADAVGETVADTLAETAAATRREPLRGLPSLPSNTLDPADAAEIADVAAVEDAVIRDAQEAAEDTVAEIGAAEVSASARAETEVVSTEIPAAPAAPVTTAVGPARVATATSATANPTQADKPDQGGFTTAQAPAQPRKLDKPDVDSFFTTSADDEAINPCVKADGTPYVGPGTVTNPFADESPCIQPVTASSFDVAGSETLPPRATDSDVQMSPPDVNTAQQAYFNDQPSVFIPLLGAIGSDYAGI